MSRRIWIVDDDESIRWVLERAFTDANWKVELFSSAQGVLNRCEQALQGASWPQVVLTDVRMPGADGMGLMSYLKEIAPGLPVIIMTAHSDLDSAVSAFKGGAFEYVAKPFDLNDVLEMAERARNIGGNKTSVNVEPVNAKVSEIIGEAPAMQTVFRAIGRLAQSSISVLITGASGTGKELVAHALHKHSSRAEKPFIALNMAAIPGELIESELFGHEKGAFTGAFQKRQGRFQQATGGTLFLDEIGDMPVAVQTRLLRVLAEGQFYPVGSHQLVRVDVRIIAATHQDLRKAVHEGRFREDLYHRLNVIHLPLPTLEERREDIPALARHFLQKASSELQMPAKKLTHEAIEALRKAPWPGNVRQLENTCRWLMVMSAGEDIRSHDLPSDIQKPMYSEVSSWLDALEKELTEAFQTGREGAFKPFEDAFTGVAMKIALNSTGGHRQHAAKLLGWGRNTLTRKMKS